MITTLNDSSARAELTPKTQFPTSTLMDMREAINNTLRTMMAADDRIYLLGQDIGLMGGMFGVTAGLQQQFGEHRVIDGPLSETGLVGAAIGMAMFGLRPVVEIEFMDFILPAADQIVNELAKLRYRSGGQFTAPVVIRTPCGGGIRGGLYHSQSLEAFFLHVAGLKVVMPSTPQDAKGLLRTAVEENDPVLFLEPKKLYTCGKRPVPLNEFRIPIGSGTIARPGKDMTLITYGAMVEVALQAAELANAEQIDCEVVDLRTLSPWDESLVFESVARTGRATILHEAPLTCGFGAEISARISEELFADLRAPVARVAACDTPCPYALEHLYYPDPERVFRTIKEAL